MWQASAESSYTRTFEWPTLLAGAALYLAFGLLTWNYDALAWWIVLPLGGYLVAWHGSLQHEAVHGHPTRWRWLNEAFIFPSLWLWMPYRSYRTLHLTHHRNDHLTDPLEDPESYYVTATRWARMGPIRRTLLRANNSLLGRLVIGPGPGSPPSAIGRTSCGGSGQTATGRTAEPGSIICWAVRWCWPGWLACAAFRCGNTCCSSSIPACRSPFCGRSSSTGPAMTSTSAPSS
jgi:fatty acid desaturase